MCSSFREAEKRDARIWKTNHAVELRFRAFFGGGGGGASIRSYVYLVQKLDDWMIYSSGWALIGIYMKSYNFIYPF